MSQIETSPESMGLPRSTRKRQVRGFLIVLMGCLAIAAPFLAGSLALFLVGLLLIVCGILEMLETFQAPDQARQRSAYLSGALSVLAGMFLLAQPQLAVRGLAWLVAGSFLLDGISKLIAAVRTREATASWQWLLGSSLVNVGLALVLATGWPVSGLPVVVILVGVHMLTAGWGMLLGRTGAPGPRAEESLVGRHPDGRLRLPAHAEFDKLEGSLKTEEEGRHWIDAYWCWMFVFVFFAIHIGRMQVPWNLVGMISPLVAVLGDVATALLIAYALILPYRLGWRWLTRPVERRAWTRVLARIDQDRGPGPGGRLSRRWLLGRMRFSRRMALARSSPRAALRWGLQVGLPVTAILIAVNPIWGFSWFFNSESWVSEVWNRWAEARTDTWREAMLHAVRETYPDSVVSEDRLFRVEPERVAGSADFSFLVLGDTGEGDASQHCLRDRFLFLGQRPDVKFLIVSSDVIYPSGAMSDYEQKFYLPFKGFTKPIYAIPGNHDWFDALEGFAANFLEADAARASMRARVVADGRVSTTTDDRIDAMIREAARLRDTFAIRNGSQRGPCFEIQTERFALVAIDTGVLRRVDTAQWQWLQAALGRAQGKFTLAILGHPLYSGGRYQGREDEPIQGSWMGLEQTPQLPVPELGAKTESFAAIHRLLREHEVEVVMAGDTHYFEHYRESYPTAAGPRTMLHFVNGGGGAYISIGTPLDWPAQPAVPDCAFFPRTDFLIAKLDHETPGWKEPLWQWVKRLGGWPVTAEALAGAFDYNQVPYLQSFLEVRVEGSANQVRLIAHGANGPLRWRELQRFGTVMPAGTTDDDVVEFIVPMPARRP